MPTEGQQFFRLSTRQVDVAVRYIEEHKDGVVEGYQRISDAAKGFELASEASW